MSRRLAVVSAALGVAALVALGAPEHGEATSSGTRQLRIVVIRHTGDLAKSLREIDALRKQPPRSEWDVRRLQIAFWEPLAIRAEALKSMKRTGGHRGLRLAATRMFTEMANWGLHSSRMIEEAYRGRRAGAKRESDIAARHLHNARIAQIEVTRLLRATG